MRKPRWRSLAAALIAAAGFTAASAQADAATLPYEYTFVTTTAMYDEDIEGVKQMVITYDQDISVNTADRNNDNAVTTADLIQEGDLANDPVYVLEQGGNERINIIQSISVSEPADQVTITFKNLEYLNLQDEDRLRYVLKIAPNVLRFDQKELTLPFDIYDVLPGFQSTFVASSPTEINERIFKYNAPRDVFIYVPKAYIQSVETIHRYQGVVEQDGNRIGDPALTNIDILADEDAQFLNVALGNGVDEYERDLTRRTDDVEGFTMGQAGIDALVCADIANCDGSQLLDAFTLKAYNQYGRLLETRSFRLRVTDEQSDFFIDDYFPEPTDEFGSTYTLYDLMAEKELLENILLRMPVDELNRIGVTYSVGGGAAIVENEEQFAMALANPTIHTISFGIGGSFDGDWTINRDLILNTNASTLTGRLTIGDGSDIDVKINGGTLNAPNSALKTDIRGMLTVDAGPNGTVILNNVDAVGGTTIVSGGINSVHLKQFTSTPGIDLTNSKPLRVVSDGQLESQLNVKGKGEVTLAGGFKQVHVEESTVMYGTPNMTIEALTIASDEKLLLIGPGLIGQTTGEMERQNNGSGTSTVKETLAAQTITILNDGNNEASIVWSPGNTIKGNDVTGIQWGVKNPSIFGTNTVLSYNKDGDGKLMVSGATSITGTITQDVVLQGNKGSLYFEITVPVTLKREVN